MMRIFETTHAQHRNKVFEIQKGAKINKQRERDDYGTLGESRLLPCKKYLTLFSFSTTVVIKERIFYANKDLVCSFRSTA